MVNKLFGKLTIKSGKKKSSKNSPVTLKVTSDSAYTPLYDVREKDLPKLHQAAWNGNKTKVKQLVKGNPDGLDYDGRTALHLSCAQGHADVLTTLLQCKASTKIPDKEGRLPLVKAVQNQHLQCVEILLQQQCDVNAVDNSGNSYLHFAGLNGATSIIAILLQSGANLDACNKAGQTPLHLACKQMQLDACRLLIERGADIDASDSQLLTPLMLACDLGEVRLVELLLSLNADVTLKDSRGWAAADHALMAGKEACVLLVANQTGAGEAAAGSSRGGRSGGSSPHLPPPYSASGSGSAPHTRTAHATQSLTLLTTAMGRTSSMLSNASRTSDTSDRTEQGEDKPLELKHSNSFLEEDGREGNSWCSSDEDMSHKYSLSKKSQPKKINVLKLLERAASDGRGSQAEAEQLPISVAKDENGDRVSWSDTSPESSRHQAGSRAQHPVKHSSGAGSGGAAATGRMSSAKDTQWDSDDESAISGVIGHSSSASKKRKNLAVVDSTSAGASVSGVLTPLRVLTAPYEKDRRVDSDDAWDSDPTSGGQASQRSIAGAVPKISKSAHRQDGSGSEWDSADESAPTTSRRSTKKKEAVTMLLAGSGLAMSAVIAGHVPKEPMTLTRKTSKNNYDNMNSAGRTDSQEKLGLLVANGEVNVSLSHQKATVLSKPPTITDSEDEECEEESDWERERKFLSLGGKALAIIPKAQSSSDHENQNNLAPLIAARLTENASMTSVNNSLPGALKDVALSTEMDAIRKHLEQTIHEKDEATRLLSMLQRENEAHSERIIQLKKQTDLANGSKHDLNTKIEGLEYKLKIEEKKRAEADAIIAKLNDDHSACDKLYSVELAKRLSAEQSLQAREVEASRLGKENSKLEEYRLGSSASESKRQEEIQRLLQQNVELHTELELANATIKDLKSAIIELEQISAAANIQANILKDKLVVAQTENQQLSQKHEEDRALQSHKINELTAQASKYAEQLKLSEDILVQRAQNFEHQVAALQHEAADGTNQLQSVQEKLLSADERLHHALKFQEDTQSQHHTDNGRLRQELSCKNVELLELQAANQELLKRQQKDSDECRRVQSKLLAQTAALTDKMYSVSHLRKMARNEKRHLEEVQLEAAADKRRVASMQAELELLQDKVQRLQQHELLCTTSSFLPGRAPEESSLRASSHLSSHPAVHESAFGTRLKEDLAQAASKLVQQTHEIETLHQKMAEANEEAATKQTSLLETISALEEDQAMLKSNLASEKIVNETLQQKFDRYFSEWFSRQHQDLKPEELSLCGDMHREEIQGDVAQAKRSGRKRATSSVEAKLTKEIGRRAQLEKRHANMKTKLKLAKSCLQELLVHQLLLQQHATSKDESRHSQGRAATSKKSQHEKHGSLQSPAKARNAVDAKKTDRRIQLRAASAYAVAREKQT